MKLFILFAALAIAVEAKPFDHQSVQVTQDTRGQYNVDVKTFEASRSENRDINGDIVGMYSYIDGDGVLQHVSYTSGVNGYRAYGNTIPQPVQDTPEVAQARAEHQAKLYELY